tara:strand:- start:354 stop:482 length:129 start_codon:yes stop_codon:yes gene_type:complete
MIKQREEIMRIRDAILAMILGPVLFFSFIWMMHFMFMLAGLA